MGNIDGLIIVVGGGVVDKEVNGVELVAWFCGEVERQCKDCGYSGV